MIIGGGPGGYEAALVASQLGGAVTLIEDEGLGGSAVLTGTVPSKTLVATAEVMTEVRGSAELGVRFGPEDSGDPDRGVSVDLAAVNARVLNLARTQSADITERVLGEHVTLLRGRGRLDGPERVVATLADGTQQVLDADIVLLATGSRARELPEAAVDGERILSWRHLYALTELPERLVVVGSGVTGAEFASAYDALGCDVVLVSSRDRVLPGEDADAAQVLEDVFTRRGMTVLSRSRAASVVRDGDGVVVTLTDGRRVQGSHCLLAVGSIPNTEDLGLETTRVETRNGNIVVDRVSRTRARGVYAAGDCTGVLPLASVAAMQGRIAMYHALGDAVAPLDLLTVSSNVFTTPEIATVGVSQQQVDDHVVPAREVVLRLRGNPRAKMQGSRDGFVKLFCRSVTGIVIGGVVVAPKASELIYPIALAISQRLTVDQLSASFTVYPSLSGSIAEAARRLHGTRSIT